MRQQSKNKIDIRGTIIGGEQPCICLPLVTSGLDDLLSEAVELIDRKPDILEWRVDSFSFYGDIDGCLNGLTQLRQVIGEMPLIFTCRSDREGGMQKLSQQLRQQLVMRAMATGMVDIVDVELDNDDLFLDDIIKEAKNMGVALILSHHNFTKTPTESIICDMLYRAQKRGADIAKIAVMPSCYADVLILLNATNSCRTGKIHIPMITISMGEEGGVSRLAGGLFGSDVTFAAGKESSAPGQHAINDLRAGMSLLYNLTPVNGK